jgi:hypothetical protein
MVIPQAFQDRGPFGGLDSAEPRAAADAKQFRATATSPTSCNPTSSTSKTPARLERTDRLHGCAQRPLRDSRYVVRWWRSSPQSRAIGGGSTPRRYSIPMSRRIFVHRKEGDAKAPLEAAFRARGRCARGRESDTNSNEADCYAAPRRVFKDVFLSRIEGPTSTVGGSVCWARPCRLPSISESQRPISAHSRLAPSHPTPRSFASRRV